ncbi:MAG: hypothetical protein Q9173_006552 [Seirophora scorigena]
MYTRVPKNLKTDNVIPPVSEIPMLIRSLRHPRKHRSVSIGPQSEADAYEALALRDRKRRESHSSASRLRHFSRNQARSDPAEGALSGEIILANSSWMPRSTGLPTPAPSHTDLREELLSTDVMIDDPLSPSTLASASSTPNRRLSEDRREQEEDAKEIFSMLEKPRVRYDVEVITKLIVYTGIAWLAVEGNPLLFELIGLGFKP